MFYLIDRGTVAQLAGLPFEIATSQSLFWVEANDGAAQVGDKYVNGVFEPRYTLEDRQYIRLVALENVFTMEMGSGITFNDNMFYSAADSRELIAQALASEDRGIPVFPTQWFLKNGQAIDVTYDDMKAVSALLVDKVKGCYYNREVLRQQILQSPNPESVDLTVGWPVNA